MDADDFFLDLFGGNEQMGVVLGKAAHAHQAVERAGQFVAVHNTEFAHAQRQLAIAPGFALVNQYAARAVHGLEAIGLVVNGRGVDILLVVVPVAGFLPQMLVEHDGRAAFHITVFPVQLAPEAFQFVAQHHALGEEEGEARAFVENVEQVQLAAQLAVIALFGLFQTLHIGVQLFAAYKRRAVNALEHLVFFIAAPIRAGDGHAFEGLDAAGGGQVRPGAQVGKAFLFIEGNDAVFGKVVDQFHLIGFVFHELQGFLAGQLKAFEFGIFLDDARHFLFHVLEELGRGGLVHIKIVVKTVVDGRADGQLRLGAKRLHGLRQHVAGGMAQRPAAVGIVKGEDFQFAVLSQRLHQRNKFAVEARHQGALFYVLGQLFQHVQGADARRKFHFLTVYDQLHFPTSRKK